MYIMSLIFYSLQEAESSNELQFAQENTPDDQLWQPYNSM